MLQIAALEFDKINFLILREEKRIVTSNIFSNNQISINYKSKCEFLLWIGSFITPAIFIKNNLHAPINCSSIFCS